MAKARLQAFKLYREARNATATVVALAPRFDIIVVIIVNIKSKQTNHHFDYRAGVASVVAMW